MKKLRIKNKKQFARAIVTILLIIVGIVLITMFMNQLRVEGLGSLFTIGAYKEAFEVTSADIKLINLFEIVSICSIIYFAYQYLDYHAGLIKLERQERLAINNI